MAEPGPAIQIPRWIQLVGLPVLAVLAYLLASTLGHALFLFLTASVIAFLLNPLVRAAREGPRPARPRGRDRVPDVRGGVVIVVALATVVVDQTRSAADRARLRCGGGRTYGLTGAELDLDRLEGWLRDRGIGVELREQVQRVARLALRRRHLRLHAGRDLVGAGRGDLVRDPALLDRPDHRDLDLHAPRHAEAGMVDRGSRRRPGLPLAIRIESALAGYVRGQLLLSTIIGSSAGVGMWLLGTLDLVPGAGATRCSSGSGRR